jgi:hypothetical protein
MNLRFLPIIACAVFLLACEQPTDSDSSDPGEPAPSLSPVEVSFSNRFERTLPAGHQVDGIANVVTVYITEIRLVNDDGTTTSIEPSWSSGGVDGYDYTGHYYSGGTTFPSPWDSLSTTPIALLLLKISSGNVSERTVASTKLKPGDYEIDFNWSYSWIAWIAGMIVGPGLTEETDDFTIYSEDFRTNQNIGISGIGAYLIFE